MNKKYISWILIAVGAFFAFLPHRIHVQVGASYVDHPVHVAFGVVCLLIGGWLCCKGKRMPR